ncbi:SIR2 family protein [Flectobacillus roseus]|uniref:SIR2 family protein n=1 Tax=Flectobacillus roseus TaxID=502259 RepID=UPI0024B6CF2B|nr:SIR2 family protein [Flectobacillus roseus]MDI9871517.1 SIR2 family protein [Flectobacillus roseus]
MNNFTLEYDAFIRSVKVNQNSTYAMLLGAGASISSGIQSAYDCIWEWKKDIYISKNPQYSDRYSNYQDEQIRDNIQNWLDNEGIYPPKDSEEEYSFYANKAYPIESDRSSYFRNIIQGKQPGIGYQLACLLAEAEIVKSIWTTNFDGLAVKVAHQMNLTPIEITLDSVERIHKTFSRKELLCVALHGDYKYGPLKNTSKELDNQNDVFVETLIRYLNDKHLIINGYSGRDKSLMNALTKVYSTKGAGRLYWCGKGDNPLTSVEELIETAKNNGREAFYIPTEGFDETMIALSKVCFENNPTMLTKAKELMSNFPTEKIINTNFSLETPFINTVLKSNLFPLKLPKAIYQFDFEIKTDKSIWTSIQEITKNTSVVAAPLGSKILAFGLPSDIQELFKNIIRGDLEQTPLSTTEVMKSGMSYLLIKSITRSLSTLYPTLLNNDKNVLWSKKVVDTMIVNGKRYTIHQAMKLSITSDFKYKYLCCKPEIVINEVGGAEIPKEVKKSIKADYFKNQYNNKFENFVDNWRSLIFPSKNYLEFNYPVTSESGFKFKISPSPAFAKIMKAGSKKGETLSPNFNEKVLVFKGIQYDEPKLVFSSLSGEEKRDFHPMRGLVNNRPYDYPTSTSIGSNEVKLGVICPDDYSEDFYKFLNQQNQSIPKEKYNPDYLIDFPSFYSAYGITLNIPYGNSKRWIDCKTPIKYDNKQSALELANIITTSLQRIANEGVSVVVIFIPNIWSSFLKIFDEEESFDLHDYIKAFAAEHSIATQLIQEDTLKDPLRCQVNWWLSLSFYVKAMRTPWLLSTADNSSAYVGIGYGINRHREQGKVVLGCSHIYNSQGQGLKYKLSKVEDPQWDAKQKNPYLSYDDAFKFGLSIGDLTQNSIARKTERVVIHKRTHFTTDEIQGLIAGLSKVGIVNVDLVEINIEDNTRFTANKIVNSMPQSDTFPLNRGTCILLNEKKALLYTHGVVPSVQNPTYRYYLGGRGIPAPLVIKKHYGGSNIGTIANEILGLTKMNWNSMDLYSILPSTISSSNEIARISSLLARFRGKTYDYRYFI